MNRNKIEPINTLPWGRPAQSDTDAEWELLRASAVDRTEHEAYAEQLSYHPETSAAQPSNEDEAEDEDEEAAWAAIYAQRQSQELVAEDEALAQQQAWEQQALAQQQQWAEQQARDEQRAWEEQQAWEQQQAELQQQAWEEEQALLAEQQAYVQQQALFAQQQAYEQQQAYAQQQQLLAQQHFEQQAWQQHHAHAQQQHAGYAQPSYGQRQVAPADPFAPLAAPAFQEPVAVQATPSVAPGQMRAPDLAPAWDDSPADFAPTKSGSSWVPKVLIGIAAAVAVAIGVQSMQAETERQAKVAAAEKARVELMKADQDRLAEEAHRAEIERLAAEGRAKAAAAAAAAAAPVVAPTAPRPTGMSRARPAKRHNVARGRKAPRDDRDEQVAGEDSGSDKSNDPIFGL